jgi:hypothetical protein
MDMKNGKWSKSWPHDEVEGEGPCNILFNGRGIPTPTTLGSQVRKYMPPNLSLPSTPDILEPHDEPPHIRRRGEEED